MAVDAVQRRAGYQHGGNISTWEDWRRGKNEKKVVGQGMAVMVGSVPGGEDWRNGGVWCGISQRLIAHRFSVVVVVVMVIYFAPMAELHRRTGSEESQGDGCDTFMRRVPRRARERRRRSWLAGGWLALVYPHSVFYSWDDKGVWFAEIFFRFSGRLGYYYRPSF